MSDDKVVASDVPPRYLFFQIQVMDLKQQRTMVTEWLIDSFIEIIFHPTSGDELEAAMDDGNRVIDWFI